MDSHFQLQVNPNYYYSKVGPASKSKPIALISVFDENPKIYCIYYY